MSIPAASGERDEPAEGWAVLASPDAAVRMGRIPTSRAVVARMVGAAALVSLVIGTIAFFVSNRLAEQDTLLEGIRISDILSGELRPHLTKDLVDGFPASLVDLDSGIRPAMSQYGILRVKVFDADTHRVLYSDEPRLIGQTFPWSQAEASALATSRPLAAITKPEGDENEYEQVAQLVEVRRSVAGLDGRRALLEVYLNYDVVSVRATQMWRAFVALLVGSLLMLTVMIIPVAFQLLRRIAEGTRQREQLLQRAVEASDLERRRIAGSLHDGPVQELVANTLVLSGAAGRLEQAGQTEAAHTVDGAAAAVRRTVGSLRSLLVELYPASLAEQGLTGALDDLTAPLRSRGIVPAVAVDPDATPSEADQRLIYRVAQECLRNAAKHSGATAVRVGLSAASGGWIATIADNGRGFDVHRAFNDPAPGHIGVRILSDLAAEAGAGLRVSSGPEGTTWELTRGGSR